MWRWGTCTKLLGNLEENCIKTVPTLSNDYLKGKFYSIGGAQDETREENLTEERK